MFYIKQQSHKHPRLHKEKKIYVLQNNQHLQDSRDINTVHHYLGLTNLVWALPSGSTWLYEEKKKLVNTHNGESIFTIG